MSVSVIVPARNAARTLPATLAALGAQRFDEPYEVIVVDNASTDSTGDIARAAGATVVPGPGRGPGAARMAGVRAARHDLLAFTDADCAPEPGWLAAGVAVLRSGGHALVQGWTGPPDDVVCGPWDRTLRVGAAIGLYETANLFVAREAFEAAGGFGDGLEAPGHAPFGEDVLLGWALHRRGESTAFAPEARVRHWVFPRDFRGHLSELERRSLFPHLVRAVPELRGSMLLHGVFLHPRDEAFTAAATGVALALLTRRPAPLVATLPWARHVVGDARRLGPRLTAGRALSDAYGVLSALRGSVQARTLVL